MRTQKISLDFLDIPEEEFTIGLVRLIKQLPAHELFFLINSQKNFTFERQNDLIIRGEFFDYHFPRYRSYHQESKDCLTLTANKSSEGIIKKLQDTLFPEEEHIKFLLAGHTDVDYLLTSGDTIDDFSLILLPENLVFQIQPYSVPPRQELYSLIRYYE